MLRAGSALRDDSEGKRNVRSGQFCCKTHSRSGLHRDLLLSASDLIRARRVLVHARAAAETYRRNQVFGQISGGPISILASTPKRSLMRSGIDRAHATYCAGLAELPDDK